MSQKKNNKSPNSGDGVDLLDKQETKNESQVPSKYKVIYHNDDFTPMDLVTLSLIEIFHHPIAKAIVIMESVHRKGREVAGGPYSKEIAETKCKSAVQFFRSLGYPLLSTFEKE
jgi:ATP-dependent Clp protease adaptor protein ClpS